MKLLKNKNILILTIFLILLILIFFFYLQKNDGKKPPYICINNECFFVELAKDEISRQNGLMKRESLGQDRGMLFVFDNEEIQPFWMKDTLIPLDIVWINPDLKIVEISTLYPCNGSNVCETYVPKNKALYVLEINAGIAQEINLKVGDKAEIKF